MLDQKKQKIAFKDGEEYAEVSFQNQKILVKPYLSLTDQIVLLEVCVEEYFSNDLSGVISSEHKLILAVLDQCTNIEVGEDTIPNILRNYKLWKEINSKIQNYGAFRALLNQTIEELKEKKRLEKSLGNMLEKVLDFVSGLSEISPESIDKIKELLKEVDNSAIFKKAVEIYGNKS